MPQALRTTCWAAAAVGAALLAMTFFSPAWTVPSWIAKDRFLPAILLALPGLLVSAPLALLRQRGEEPRPFLAPAMAFILAGVILSIGVVMAAGVQAEAVKPVTAALLVLFGALTLLVAIYALEVIRLGEGVSLESHWGGLGGSLGGWRLSTAGVLGVLFLALASATILVAVIDIDHAAGGEAPPDAAAPSAPKAKAEAAPPTK